MKKTVIISLLAALAAIAQSTTPAVSLSLSAPAGAQGDGKNATIVPLAVSIAGTAGRNASMAQWSMALPPGVTIVPNGATASGSVQTAGKNIVCGVDVGGCPTTYQGVGNCGLTVCMVVGLLNGVVSNNPLTVDGVLGTIPVSIPVNTPSGDLSFGVVNTLGVDTAANPLLVAPGAAGSTPVTLHYSVVNPCDVTGDGTVNYSDALAVLMALENPVAGKCPFASAACTLQNLQAVIQAAMGQACVLH